MVSTALPSNRRLILYFVLLAAFLPEAITGSTPPQSWLNPLSALLNFWLYGTGVLVVREVSLRWRTGWPGILTLGAAYGIVEEGLAVTTFFNPTLPQVGVLGVYGRWLGVNWVWTVWLSEFHATVSIAIPILLMEWHWPPLKGTSILSDRGLYATVALLGLATVTINILVSAVNPFRSNPVLYLGAILVIAALAYVARNHSGRLWQHVPATGNPRSPRVHVAAGFVFIGGSFLLYSGGPTFAGFPLLTVAQGLALLVVALLFLRRTSSRPDGEVLQFAFAAGVVLFFCVFDWFLVAAGNVLMILPSLAFGCLVVWLWRERPLASRQVARVPAS